ncbi:hypothetical protein GDO78_020926 [Eleutherodactylus coqui]|uniref:Taste receptor type 2 member 40 n=1 Tax=Eleutherodactylus coqui TaxID=57060 RepID=A0A8J6JT09_ELECQ|nr:hypothetical protein GDO78_020926 [Eleutherodactylus coqui]
MKMECVLTAALYVIYLVGLTANLIIVAANVMKWKSLKSLQTCDKILISLAISRSLCLFCIIIDYSTLQFLPWLRQNNNLLSTLNILGMSMMYNSLWIATILCVFYCVKIATYNCKLFVFLKTRISTMVPGLISVSLLISLISSLPFGWVHSNLKLQKVLNESTENMTLYNLAITEIFTYQLLIFVIMYLICSSLYITGLHLHLKHSIFIYGIILCSPPMFHSLYIISSSSEIKKMFVLMCLGLFRCS